MKIMKKKTNQNICSFRFACVWYTIGFREGRGGPGRRVCSRKQMIKKKIANCFFLDGIQLAG